VASFLLLNGTGHVCMHNLNRRNNEAWAHVAMWAYASLSRRFTDTNLFGTGSVKM